MYDTSIYMYIDEKSHYENIREVVMTIIVQFNNIFRVK